MLIDYQECEHDPFAEATFPSPVVGSVVNERTPTSADVHLYVDPDTYYGERPILYADCEGLEAGEEIPISLRQKFRKDPKRFVKIAGRARPLAWATSDQKRTRQFAVGELYPRLLYTFSDVVVFVLRNVKYVSQIIDIAEAMVQPVLIASTEYFNPPHYRSYLTGANDPSRCPSTSRLCRMPSSPSMQPRLECK